jgi:hypothetical protein
MWMKRLPSWTVLSAAILLLAGCGWQGYLVTHGINHFTGKPTRFHSIVPLTGALDSYRVVEVKPLENLLFGQIPPQMEAYLDEEISRQLLSVKSKPEIVGHDEAQTTQVRPTLVFEGYIDDYDPGYVGLRLVELGFNHVAVTVRFQLRDKQTGEIVGAASITAQDDRVTASPKAAINTIAKRIRSFTSSGYGAGK